MTPSPFARILEMVVQGAGARGAIFVDWEGEAVDSFTHTEEEEIKLIGAHWCIIFFQTKALYEKLGLAVPDEMVLSFSHHQLVIRRVTDEYLAIVALERGGSLGRAQALMGKAATLLRREM